MSFALEIVRVVGVLPNRVETWILGKQLLRSGTSIGANYREAQRARSKAEFYSKIHICLQEAEETRYWLELIVAAKLLDAKRAELLIRDVTELIAIFVAIANKASNSDKADGH